MVKKKRGKARKKQWVPSDKMLVLFLFVLSFIFYGNTISNDFALDDLIVLTGNQFTKQGFAGIDDIMTSDAFVGAYGEALNLSGGRYRPLSIVTLAIEYQLFGLNAPIHHFVNVLLYALSIVMLFLTFRAVLKDNNWIIPFIISLLFLIHPVHTEVVANIKSRDEIMMLLFGVTSLYILFTRETLPWYFLAAGIYFLGLLSKENAITFMGIIPLAWILFKNKNIKEIAIRLAPFLVVTLLYLFMRDTYAGMIGDRVTTDIMDDPYMRSGFGEKMATIMFVMLLYLKLLFFPHPLSYDYSYNHVPVTSFTDPLVIISVLIHLALLFAAFYFFNKKKLIAFGILTYFGTVFLVSNIVFNIGTSMADRFLYLPSLGFCVVLAFLLTMLLKIPTKNAIDINTKWVLPLVALVFIAGLKTTARNKDWKDNFTLYEADHLKVPNSARSRLYYGIELISKYNRTQDLRDISAAIEQIKLAAKINPEFTYAYHNLGVAYQKIDRHDEAIECYTKLLDLEPDNANALYGLGISYGKGKGNAVKAISYLEQLFNDKQQARSEYYDNLGLCYAISGQTNKAGEILQEGLQLYPNNANLLFNLGVLYSNTGKTDSASVLMNRAFALDPSLRGNRAP